MTRFPHLVIAGKYFFDFLGREVVTLNVEDIAVVPLKPRDQHKSRVAECIYDPLRTRNVQPSAACHACQKDQRIKACLNQDGAMASQPYYADARGWGMDQPFMLIERAVRTEPPSDEELAAMKLTRARANEIRNRLDANRDRVLRATGKGSYHVVLQRSATTHMDFSDLQLLGAQSSSDRETRKQVLTTVRSYTRAFFDRHIRGMRSPLPEARAPNRIVEKVLKLGPAKRPK